jgi:hypothetical protein
MYGDAKFAHAARFHVIFNVQSKRAHVGWNFSFPVSRRIPRWTMRSESSAYISEGESFGLIQDPEAPRC